MFERFNLRGLYAFGASFLVHVAILAALWFIRNTLVQAQPEVVVDSVLDEERVQEEFTQELDVENEIAQTLNVVAGGVASTTPAASGQTLARQQRIETSDVIKTPDVQVRVADVSLPGDAELGMELGESEVEGETAAVVPGYGAALHRITQELIRMMRDQKVVVVWLFDQSESMTDDQREIKENFHKVYEELGIAAQQDKAIRKDREILLTTIASYGQGINFITPQPTAEIAEIRAAIDSIQVDPTGKENMCSAIAAAIDKHRTLAARQDRKLVVVVVSDESGDDGQVVEQTLERATLINAPIFILGRESVFGYPYAVWRWVDPKYKTVHWLRINRGPETAFPEGLQWDGLRSRYDAFNAGFGPYEMVRLCKESGGIFFVLPGDEEDLAGPGAHERRKYDFIDMKEYQPMLLPRRDYIEQRERSDFRSTIFRVIALLNPNKDAVDQGRLPQYNPNLNIREHWYPLENAEFRQAALVEVKKAADAMMQLNVVIPLLEKIGSLRERETYQRWRAAYDLIRAQCIAYRVRLFQFLLAMDNHANNMPAPTNERSNRWNVRRTTRMLTPDDGQWERLKQAFAIKMEKAEYLAHLQEKQDEAVAMYRTVIETHPRTPWARRAQYELDHGFGMEFVEAYWDPNYDAPDRPKPPNP
ncbi:MAG: VWA domain-containing protein [Planctomycetes bacterium]|nr:VWA domain-containing protein [Planctomycetota bacterium]